MAKQTKPKNRKWTTGTLSFAQQLVVGVIRLVAATFNLLSSAWDSLDSFDDWLS